MPVVEIAREVVPKRTFVWAVDWPGWCRAAKTPDLAIEAWANAAARYAAAIAATGIVPPDVDPAGVRLVETVDGNGGTEFGVPSMITAADRRPTSTEDAARLAAIVDAAWATFDRVAAGAPASLRKGPRGGGRDRDRMIEHVLGADHAYAREVGVRVPPPAPDDRLAIRAERAAVLAVLVTPSNGSALADRRWTARYAARRIAWHALDHAWEMEDRTEDPGQTVSGSSS
jgi:hypothetical protein